MEFDRDTGDEILRLTRENNKMLRAMRRSSLVGAVFKTIMWIVLIIVPLWFYVEYIAPVMESMLETYQQLQGTNAAAQAQFGQFTDSLDKLQSLFGTSSE